MNRQPPSQTATLQPYVRQRRIDVEPALFALGVLAVVLSISGWKPLAAAQQAAAQQAAAQQAATQQAAPAQATHIAAAAPRT